MEGTLLQESVRQERCTFVVPRRIFFLLPAGGPRRGRFPAVFASPPPCCIVFPYCTRILFRTGSVGRRRRQDKEGGGASVYILHMPSLMHAEGQRRVFFHKRIWEKEGGIRSLCSSFVSSKVITKEVKLLCVMSLGRRFFFCWSQLCSSFKKPER